jgi:hypothetical protein
MVLCRMRSLLSCGRGHLKMKMGWLCKICTYINFLYIHTYAVCAQHCLYFIYSLCNYKCGD